MGTRKSRERYRFFSAEEIAWVKEVAYGLTKYELLDQFNSRYDPINMSQLKNMLARNRILLGKKLRYRKEHRDFIIECYCSRHMTMDGVLEEFNARFPDFGLTYGQLSGFLSYNRLTNGMVGRKNAGWFKEGTKPQNTKPVGTVSKWCGHDYVKTEDGFVKMDRFIYEQNHGKIPKYSMLIHVDRNESNNSIDNLVVMDRSEVARLIQNRLVDDAETNAMTIALCKLESAISRRGTNSEQERNEGDN